MKKRRDVTDRWKDGRAKETRCDARDSLDLITMDKTNVTDDNQQLRKKTKTNKGEAIFCILTNSIIPCTEKLIRIYLILNYTHTPKI